MPDSAGTPAQPAIQPAIMIDNLVQSFSGKERVLDGVTFSIPAHKTSFLLGPSGTGKSVLLKHIVALIRPESGRIEVFGERLPYGDRNRLNVVRRRFGVLFQGGALFDNMNVLENVAFPLKEHRRTLPRSKIRDLVASTLRSVGLDPETTLSKYPSQLSGGMLKRVALARAIILKPEIVLYDEPTTGLDPVNRLTVNEMISDAERKLGLTNFVISHDIDAALALADTIAFLHQGRILFHGSPAEFSRIPHGIIKDFLQASERVKRRPRQ